MARATVSDVAKRAGVSTATVSRVLTGSEKVSDQLRTKVLKAAAALDYSVNTAARALRRDRTSVVGMVVPDLSNPFFTLLVDLVERDLQLNGLSLHLCSSSNDPEVEAKRIRSLRQSRVAALVVIPNDAVRSGDALREAVAELPVVQLDQFADDVEASWVGVDEPAGMKLIFEHLEAQGVRNAAYVGGELSDSSARVRYEAAIAEARSRGVSLDSRESLQGSVSVAWGAAVAADLGAANLPDAVVCAADVIALGVLQGFDAIGVEVPSDVLVTGFDDIPLSSHPRLSITTVRQPIEEIASRTVKQLVEGINDSSAFNVRREGIVPDLVVRSSSSR